MNSDMMFPAIGQVSDERIVEADAVIHSTKPLHKSNATRHMKNRSAYRRLVVVCISIVLCAAFTFPVLAVSVSNVPVVYQTLFRFSPGVAQFFMPERVSHENNGIKMEVISAVVSDNIAEIYVSIQDLTGNRIDATTDLVNSFSINTRSRLSSAGSQIVDYDDETSTLTFRIIINDYENIEADKITFTIRQFVSGRRVYDMMPFAVDFSGVSDPPDAMRMSDEHGAGFTNYDARSLGMPYVLVPSSPVDFGVEGFAITGMGYINDRLHIQMSVVDPRVNFGWFYFIDSNGNVVSPPQSFGFSEYVNGELIRFTESVYDIPLSELDKYDVYGYFVSGGVFTEGLWQITFPLERN